MHHAWQEQRPGTRRLPDEAGVLGDLLLAYELAERDPTKDYVDLRRTKLRLGMRIENLHTRPLFELADAVEAEARKLLPADVSVALTGRTLMAQAIHRSLVKGVALSLAIAIGTVFVLMLIYLRSLRLA
ncbi:MAG: MMPL family transporter, partial [Planctomycetota bacterium]